MPKYYRKRAVYTNRDKYSICHTPINGNIPSGTTTTVKIVPETTVQGMRKVKHLEISMQGPEETADGMWWAIVYVPAGTTPAGLNLTTGGELYSPSQFVMNCGVCDFSAGPTVLRSRLSRNLNAGDAIYLLLRPAASTQVAFSAVVSYAITLQ